jgi:osmoprotectant transport system permease protein
MLDYSEIFYRTGEHLILVAIAMTIAMGISLPLGIFLTRSQKLAQPILVIANILQTIPSLAIFGFLISVPFIGTGKTPAIIALILYALLPLIRNTYVGIINVDPALKEAGRGMGMTDLQLLFKVEIPLALGVILSGIRVATVICVGITTIASAIGGGGLGVFIFRGISTVNSNLILAGAVPSALMALGADYLIGVFEKQFSNIEGKKQWQNLGIGSIFVLIFIIISAFIFQSFNPSISNNNSPTITIGTKDFTEQRILGELLVQQIENKTDLNANLLDLRGTFLCHEALKAGEIDGYVEYTGTAWTGILEQKPLNDVSKVYDGMKQMYHDKFNVKVMSPLGFENTFALVIRKEDAQKYQLKTISDASQYTPQWKAAFGAEFLSREDGYPGLAKIYNLKFKQPPQEMDLGLLYQALKDKKVDLVVGNSTDGLIPKLNLLVLNDDKKYFPPYQAVPIFKQETLTKYPEIETAIAPLLNLISAEEMQQLNYQVDEEAKPVKQVVTQFLQQKNLN